MTPETRKTLLGLIVEYGNSLTRIKAEKDLMKMIEQRSVVECEVDAKSFRLYATAHHRNQIPIVRDGLEDHLAIFDVARGMKEGAA